jgi:hypothetical protein
LWPGGIKEVCGGRRGAGPGGLAGPIIVVSHAPPRARLRESAVLLCENGRLCPDRRRRVGTKPSRGTQFCSVSLDFFWMAVVYRPRGKGESDSPGVEIGRCAGRQTAPLGRGTWPRPDRLGQEIGRRSCDRGSAIRWIRARSARPVRHAAGAAAPAGARPKPRRFYPATFVEAQGPAGPQSDPALGSHRTSRPCLPMREMRRTNPCSLPRRRRCSGAIWRADRGFRGVSAAQPITARTASCRRRG